MAERNAEKIEQFAARLADPNLGSYSLCLAYSRLGF